MIRNGYLRRGALGLAIAAAALFASANGARAFSVSPGDLVVVFSKGGFDMIVNAGPAPTTSTGVQLNPSAALLAAPSQFGGTLAGASGKALAVRDPEIQFDPAIIANQARYNMSLTTNDDPNAITFNNLGDAAVQVDAPGADQAWFSLLQSVGAANGTTIIENSSDRMVVQGAGFFASYTQVLNSTTADNVAGALPISIAGMLPSDPAQLVGSALPLYELFQTFLLDSNNQPIDLGPTEVDSLGNLQLVPEPGTVLLLGSGLLGLVAFGRRDAR
jgi:hypothetical protein